MKGLGVYIYVAVVAVAAAGADEPEWYIATVDNSGPVGMMCNVAVDAADRPHVVYLNRAVPGERSLRYAYYDGNEWQISDVDTGNVGQYGDIAIDSSGHPHVSYNKCIDWVTCRGELRYAYHDGSRWHVEVVDDSGYAGLHTSIALDSHDRPHIAHRDNLSTWVGSLKHSYYDGSHWHTEVVESGADLGYHSSIALDSRDHPHISYHYYDYYNHDARVKYAYYDGSRWHVETVDTDGRGTSIALDARDRPHISYTVMGRYIRDLRYAYKDGSRWRITVVDGDRVEKHTSIALDKAGRPHISYHAWWSPGTGSESEFRYAYYDGAKWCRTVVESGGEGEYLGDWNSLALDSFGDPHVVYVFHPEEPGDEYLKYACSLGTKLDYFTATPRAYDALTLRWLVRAPLGENVTGYYLYRREKGEEEWLKVTETPLSGGASGSYDDGGLACLRTYEYLLEGIVYGRRYQLGATEGATGAPAAFVLYTARPNPSSSSAVIAFELMDRADVELSVYDLSGRRVATLAAGWLPPGGHECGCDVSALAPGVYVYRLTAGDWTGAKKMVVAR